MGQTLVEKIISEHAGKNVHAGELVISRVDVAAVQDGTGPLTVQEFKKIGVPQLKNPERSILFIDHAAPSPRKELSNSHIVLREFAKEYGAVLSDIGAGVCHQRLIETFVNPGEVLVGADSHTCTSGALGAFATGMGSTDIAVAMALGKTWLKVPATFKVVVNGNFRPGVCSKDLMLHFIGMIGADGATYKALEFHGSTIKNMTMSERFTLANMAVEAGAKCGLFIADDKTKAFLEERGRGDKFRQILPDTDAEYERIIDIDLTKIEPTVSCPHLPENTRNASELSDIKIDQVVIGSCTNGRMEDMEAAYKVLAGKKVADGVRCIIIPATMQIYRECVERGYVTAFIDAGAVVSTPTCGPCLGGYMGILAADEIAVATTNRNFVGRMGHVTSKIYLASPEVAAATAIAGKICDPNEL